VSARVSGLDAEDPLSKLPPQGLRSLVYQSKGRDGHVRVCRPTVRSSALAMAALRRSGAPERVIERLRDVLISQRADEHGDFELLGPSGPVTAWSIKPRSRRFPSLADTASVVAALSGLPGTAELELSALRWIREMQRPDGGFALFDRHAATAPWLARLPLGLLCHTLNDESSPEVTGRVLQVASSRGALDIQQIERAASFLVKRQRPDGSWHGPFSVGLLPATCAALVGLDAAGQRGSTASRRGASFLVQHQHPDGGWGESPESLEQGRYVELGRSLPTQTALALEGLIHAGAPASEAQIERAAWNLLWTQEPDGSWAEDDPCAASLADVVHLRDPIEPVARPILALSAYLDHIGVA
jgi:squalene cyclase